MANWSEPLTRTRFADLMKVHRSRITRWISAGMPTRSDGTIDVKAATDWVRRNIDPTQRVMHGHERARVQRRAEASRAPGPEPEEDPVGTAVNVALIWLSRKLPAAAARLALDEGMTREDAERIFRLTDEAATEEALAIMEWAGRPRPDGWRMPPAEAMPAEEGAA